MIVSTLMTIGIGSSEIILFLNSNSTVTSKLFSITYLITHILIILNIIPKVVPTYADNSVTKHTNPINDKLNRLNAILYMISSLGFILTRSQSIKSYLFFLIYSIFCSGIVAGYWKKSYQESAHIYNYLLIIMLSFISKFINLKPVYWYLHINKKSIYKVIVNLLNLANFHN